MRELRDLGKAALARAAELRDRALEAVKGAESNLGELRRRISDTKRELSKARNAPGPAEEIAAGIATWIDQRRTMISNEFGRMIPLAFGHPIDRPHAPAGRDQEIVFLLAADVLKAAIPNVVKALPAWEAGPPASRRAALVQRLAQELAELEAMEEAMVDEMNAAGIAVAHRPEVTQRRASEARKRERDQQAAADRQAREAAINARHARVKTSRSAYLEGR
jgi:hypothetical protein